MGNHQVWSHLYRKWLVYGPKCTKNAVILKPASQKLQIWQTWFWCWWIGLWVLNNILKPQLCRQSRKKICVQSPTSLQDGLRGHGAYPHLKGWIEDSQLTPLGVVDQIWHWILVQGLMGIPCSQFGNPGVKGQGINSKKLQKFDLLLHGQSWPFVDNWAVFFGLISIYFKLQGWKFSMLLRRVPRFRGYQVQGAFQRLKVQKGQKDCKLRFCGLFQLKVKCLFWPYFKIL